MDPAYKELELDTVEKYGGKRIWQEMAKNPALPGDHIMPTFPGGIPPAVVARKIAITLLAVEAPFT
ncbi:hypothetical protein A3F03_02920 [Candidatus Roizmanbacteria bacterium RIFCSPHIGHO2_12_FULL_41_11]|uniref:Uncharacterized protein n=2 Tax=Candidatus Roizmaniibacteriota TaxID=1752723 RepID=A0A1F7J8C3_9BACT|nr:MAG: hypothetical protein A3F03_02920 [Candidatus Roizmanbacteria bacterium RIFCSPHIGHO2_12_FULL_41_11]OGK51858.1 MAG: hypothetical protein A2966_00570 [Candidatus Roizmanbacteria bacterium RIFCSPLOWO2_01_FULL_41_22]